MSTANIDLLTADQRRLIVRSIDLTTKLDAYFDPAVLAVLNAPTVSESSGVVTRRGKIHVRVKAAPKAALAWTIGQRIRAARLGKTWTQQDLSERSGIARANVARMEAGKHSPRMETLESLAKILGLTLAKLLEQTRSVGSRKGAELAESGVEDWAEGLEKEDRAR